MSAEAIGNVLLVATWLPAVLAVAFYARVPWWRSAVGRHLFSYMLIVALVLTLGVVRIVWEPSWFWWLRVGAFALFTAATWWRLALVISEQWPRSWKGDHDVRS